MVLRFCNILGGMGQKYLKYTHTIYLGILNFYICEIFRLRAQATRRTLITRFKNYKHF